jgi:hypothetical protein
MTQPDFTEALAAEFRLRGTPHDPVSLATFVKEAWPLIQDDPAVGRWASEFAERQPEIHDGAGGVDDK